MGHPLFVLRDNIQKFKQVVAHDWKEKSVNSIITNGGKRKIFSDIIYSFKQDNDVS